MGSNSAPPPTESCGWADTSPAIKLRNFSNKLLSKLAGEFFTKEAISTLIISVFKLSLCGTLLIGIRIVQPPNLSAVVRAYSLRLSLPAKVTIESGCETTPSYLTQLPNLTEEYDMRSEEHTSELQSHV